MKKNIIFLIIFLSVFLSGSYSETIEKQLEIAEESNFSEVLSENTLDFLNRIGLEDLSYEKLSSISFSDFINIVIESILKKIKEPFKAILSVTACAIICSLIQNFMENSYRTEKIVNSVATISAASVFLLPLNEIIKNSAMVIKECSDFMLCFIPVYSSAIIASGNLSSATGFRTLMLGVSSVISRLSDEIIVPLISIYIAMCIASAVSDIKIAEISKTIKNFAVWVLTASATIFSGIMSLGTIVSSSGNSAFSKTAKLLIGTAVPIVGGTVSEALSTLKSCLEITRNILGTYAIIAIAIIFIPSIISLLSWKICLSVSAGITETIEYKNLSSLLSSASSVTGIMLALTVITAVLFIFSVSIMLLIGGN